MEHSLGSYAPSIMNETEFMTSARHNVVPLINLSGHCHCVMRSPCGTSQFCRVIGVIYKDFSKFYGRITCGSNAAVKFDTSVAAGLTISDLPLSI